MGILESAPKTSIPKPVVWVGSSRKDLITLPTTVVDTFGYGIYLAQIGRRHEKSKTLRGFGDAGVIELIDSRAANTFRAVYTVRFPVAVFVLHVFQKKAKSGSSTPKQDIELIAVRLRRAAELAKEMKW
ncbi:MAG TPA: type II toxin-antitoxin system RelE/ParE family toxin [Steroidobacteraceae bacterium]|nr:type II toxin-antitoxin system RelE/ParE family toxin [Steroidobacteraceae bacterium]